MCRPLVSCDATITIVIQEHLGSRKMRDLTARCRLGQGFSLWCIALASQADWKCVLPPLQRLLTQTFSGWIQTRVNEKANKVWREACKRDTLSGMLGNLYLWERLSSAELLQREFDREEIDINCNHSRGSQYVLKETKAFFRELSTDVRDFVNPCGDKPEDVEAADKENAWLKEFDGILRDTGTAFTPESEQVLTSELRLLRTLREKKLWCRANDAWVTALLPLGGLVHIKEWNRHVWILKTNEAAALCWPAEECARRMWRKARHVKELLWYTCFDLDEVEVLSVRVESPMALRLKDSNCPAR